MVINKRLKAIIKSKWTLILGSILLCTISVAFLIICISSGDALSKNTKDFMHDNHVEDANFTTQKPIPEHELLSLEKKYNVVIERMSYYDFKLEGNTLRILGDTKEINTYSIKSGKDISSDNELLINDSFANSNEIHIGDSIKIKNIDFHVVGYFVRPDYATPVKNATDSVINENFGIAIVGDKDFHSNYGTTYYSVIYHDDNSLKFRQMLHDDYGLFSYLAKENNNRIITASQLATGVTQMALMFGPILFLLTASFGIIIISKILKYDKAQIGILYSLGYAKKELTNFYLKIFYFIAITGSLCGIFLGQLLSAPICKFYADMNNTPIIQMKSLFNGKAIAIGIITPIIILTITGRVIIRRYLKQDVITLLRKQVEGKKRYKKFLSGKLLPGDLKYSIRSLLRNKSRFLIFIFSIFLATAIMLMGLIMKSSVTSIQENQIQENMQYKYLYVLNSYQDSAMKDGEGIVNLSWEYKDNGNMISIMGIPSNSECFLFKDEQGNSVDLDNDFYISKLLAETSNFKVGDTITLVNPVSLEEYDVIIGGIFDIDSQQSIYTNLENLNSLIGNEENQYNSIVSKKHIPVDEKILAETIKTTELMNTINSSITDSILSVVNVLMILGIGIGVIVIYMTTSMVIEENQQNISMLKVLGYTDKEITRMLFRINKYLILLIYVMAIPIILYICEIQFIGEASALNMLVPAIIRIQDVFVGLVCMFLSYDVALLISKNHIKKIAMVESLKQNRE